MKFLVVLFTVVAAFAAPLVAADQCDNALVTSIVGNGNVSDCASATGFDFTTQSTALTKDQVDTICNAEACVMLLEVLATLNVPDCTLSTGVNLRTDLINPISARCLPTSSASKSSSTSTESSLASGSVTGSLTGSVSGSLSGSTITADSSTGTTDSTTNAGDVGVGSSQSGSSTPAPASTNSAAGSWTMTTVTGSVTTLLCVAIYLA